jgi:hypothetical protein
MLIYRDPMTYLLLGWLLAVLAGWICFRRRIRQDHLREKYRLRRIADQYSSGREAGVRES